MAKVARAVGLVLLVSGAASAAGCARLVGLGPGPGPASDSSISDSAFDAAAADAEGQDASSDGHPDADSAALCSRTGAPGTLSVSREHACVLDKLGGVYCWGRNTSGELGDGTTTASDRPVRVGLTEAATQVAAGHYFTCALGTSARVWC